MRLKGLEARQFRCNQIQALYAKGRTQTAIAETLACSQAWVSKVLRLQDEPPAVAKFLGKKPALQSAHLEQLSEKLDKGALAAGFTTDNWTRARVAEVIYREFGVKHHPSHVARILAKMGYTVQKPLRYDYRQDAGALQRWRKETLPEIKKKLKKKGI